MGVYRPGILAVRNTIQSMTFYISQSLFKAHTICIYYDAILLVTYLRKDIIKIHLRCYISGVCKYIIYKYEIERLVQLLKERRTGISLCAWSR